MNSTFLHPSPGRTSKLLQLLRDARWYLNDSRLQRDEYSGKRRGETRQEYADRISGWIQVNEDLRTLCEAIDEALESAKP